MEDNEDAKPPSPASTSSRKEKADSGGGPSEQEATTKKPKLSDDDDETTDNVKKKFRVLILGASYGSLLGIKLVLAGHDATLVCRSATAQLFNQQGSVIRIPIKGSDQLLELKSKELSDRICGGEKSAGTLRGTTPDEVNDLALQNDFDLVVLAMQEPQYSAPEVRSLLQRIAQSKLPVAAVTNMPLLPFLKRLPQFQMSEEIRACFADAALWDCFSDTTIGRITQCSPDPQAFRPSSEPANVLQVRLPTNFKVARLDNPQDTALLKQLERDIDDVRYRVEGGTVEVDTESKEAAQAREIEIPVKLRVYDSLFVPLAKWSMLLAGNYRCVLPRTSNNTNDGSDDNAQQCMISIKDAVTKDLGKSRAIYEWVTKVGIRLGGSPEDFVPFDKYAKAAAALESPSSAARALVTGSAKSIERVDKLVVAIAKSLGIQIDPDVSSIVAIVDDWLEYNNRKKERHTSEE